MWKASLNRRPSPRWSDSSQPMTSHPIWWTCFRGGGTHFVCLDHWEDWSLHSTVKAIPHLKLQKMNSEGKLMDKPWGLMNHSSGDSGMIQGGVLRHAKISDVASKSVLQKHTIAYKYLLVTYDMQGGTFSSTTWQHKWECSSVQFNLYVLIFLTLKMFLMMLWHEKIWVFLD
jgi:hypothetical protein